MRSVAGMRTAKIGYIVISVLLCAMGILLIVWPELSASVIGIICGILLIVFGAVKLIGYFSKDLYRLAFQYDLAFGILLILLGVIMLVRPGGLMDFICIVLGLSILTDSLLKMQIAVDAKQFGLNKWWLILLLSVIAGIFGLVLVLRPTASASVLMVLLGITLLSEGLLNMSTAITAVKIIKHQQPDVIEVEYRED